MWVNTTTLVGSLSPHIHGYGHSSSNTIVFCSILLYIYVFRLKAAGISIMRHDSNVSSYTSIRHGRDDTNPKNAYK